MTGMDDVERKVEPSFDFRHIDKRGHSKIQRQDVGEGLDISLYLSGKLCLSPHDFYHLDEEEKNIERGLPKEIASIHLKKVFLNMLNVFPNLESAIYINNSDISNITDEISGEYLRLTVQISKAYIDDLILIERDDIEWIVNNYWARQYPELLWADKYEGNDFTAYLVQPSNFKAFIECAKKLLCDRDNALKELNEIATIVIKNLSYGYRMRISKIPAYTKSVLIGKVVHCFRKIGVAVIKLTDNDLAIEDRIYFKGHTTNLMMSVSSLEVEHIKISHAIAGQLVGVKIQGKVGVGDEVYKIIKLPGIPPNILNAI